MRIELDKLEEFGGKFSRTYQTDELALEDRDASLVNAVNIEGQVKRNGSEVKLSGHLTAEIEAPCARCLKSVRLPIDSKFSERFVPAVSWRAEELHELHEEDLNLAVFDGEAIDLDDLVREEILLALPGHVLCSEDCRGLCPICGVDKNQNGCQCESKPVDSRWEKLRELQP
jgi:uncharacterized protein